MIHGPELLLVGAVAAVGVLHTIVPDHWVPIALIARQRGWDRADRSDGGRVRRQHDRHLCRAVRPCDRRAPASAARRSRALRRGAERHRHRAGRALVWDLARHDRGVVVIFRQECQFLGQSAGRAAVTSALCETGSLETGSPAKSDESAILGVQVQAGLARPAAAAQLPGPPAWVVKLKRCHDRRRTRRA
jgi:hypothetical protein